MDNESARPRVLFVGGMDRIAQALVEAGNEVGVDVEIHHGDVHGRKSDGLAAVVGRADHVIVITSVNSHGGVLVAKKAARKAGAVVRIMRSCGLAIARGVLREIASLPRAA